ncbi:hypothetical protein [Nocardia wallacei]|uniref:hypothetical protein n=1 Tax=Nocardia wallacei TaxID=480035 RepID=UPI002457D6F0|nr:hypothetical protein [Nocardia wallacei]
MTEREPFLPNQLVTGAEALGPHPEFDGLPSQAIWEIRERRPEYEVFDNWPFTEFGGSDRPFALTEKIIADFVGYVEHNPENAFAIYFECTGMGSYPPVGDLRLMASSFARMAQVVEDDKSFGDVIDGANFCLTNKDDEIRQRAMRTFADSVERGELPAKAIIAILKDAGDTAAYYQGKVSNILRKSARGD